jgi:DNA-binding MarR family transcriptional regulator
VIRRGTSVPRPSTDPPDDYPATHPKPDPADPAATPADENVLFALWSVGRSATELLDAMLAPAGLDADEFAMYSLLLARDPVTPTELAGWASAPATTVSSYVKRFEKRGHVERVPHPTDGRSYSIRLTDAGRVTHHAAAERFLPAVQAVDAVLGSTGAPVLQALQQLRAAVRVAAEQQSAEGSTIRSG